MSITKEEMRDLLKEQAKIIGGATTAAVSKGQTEKSQATKDFEDGLNKAGNTLNNSWTEKIGAAGAAYEKLKGVITENMGMWKDLSKTGINFSGDLIGMTVAAKGMRLETSEMVEILQKNSEGLVGFGGNLNRSAEEFAKASKHFFDQNTESADALRRLGMTSKDINEVMALQGPMMRGQFRSEQERMQTLAVSTEMMATEMDLMAKLTGKSREQQMEQMKKQQADMQFDAAIREKAKQIEDPVKRAEFIRQANEELKKAELEGRGQLFKELFAFGQPLTKATATQAVMYGESTAALKKSVDALNDTQLDGADRQKKLNKAREDIAVADMKAANDSTLNRLRMLSDVTEVGGMLNKQAGATNTMTRNIETFIAKYNENENNKVKLDIKNEEDRRKAYQLMEADAIKAQKGQNAQGEQVDGTTRALTALEGRAGDVASAMFNSLVTPLNKEVSPALAKLADSVLAARGSLGGIAGPNTKKLTAAQLVEEQAEIGRGTKTPQNVVQEAGAVTGLAEKAINYTANELPGKIDKAVQAVKEYTQPAPRRFKGSYETTGKLFEDFKDGTIVQLDGVEGVFRPEDMARVAQKTVEGTLKAVPKTGNIDFMKLHESMTTSVSDKNKAQIAPGMEKIYAEISTMKNAQMMGTDKIMSEVMSGSKKQTTSEVKTTADIDRKTLKFDQFGMPITSDIKFKSAEMAQEVQKKEEKKSVDRPNVEEAKKDIAAGKPAAPEEKKPEAAKPAVASKETSLNDVVVALNQVNTKLNTLIDVQKDIGQRQIKATKANSSDVYAR